MQLVSCYLRVRLFFEFSKDVCSFFLDYPTTLKRTSLNNRSKIDAAYFHFESGKVIRIAWSWVQRVWKSCEYVLMKICQKGFIWTAECARALSHKRMTPFDNNLGLLLLMAFLKCIRVSKWRSTMMVDFGGR